MKEIPLTQGKVALVSDHHFEYLNQWKWHAFQSKSKRTWYAARNEGKRPHRKKILMHRAIENAPEGVEVDHWDCDGLNNTDENLRLANQSQNMANRTKLATNKSGFKGVHFDKRMKKYVARLWTSNKRHWLGHYDTPEDAARAYDEKAKEMFGEFARTNF